MSCNTSRLPRGLIAAWLVLWLLMPAPPDAAAQAHAPRVYTEEDYLRCLDRAKRDPEGALEFALARETEGAGAPAIQCAAAALLTLSRYAEAAARLELLADSVVLAQRPAMMAEGAQAWGLAGRPDKAAALARRALHLSPEDVELWIDLALFRADLEDYWGAVDALDRALDLAPGRSDILVYRASARRLLELTDLALDDIGRALAIAPDDPVALLERGNIRRLSGDLAGARSDWQRVQSLAPGTAEAFAAESNIAKLARE